MRAKVIVLLSWPHSMRPSRKKPGISKLFWMAGPGHDIGGLNRFHTLLRWNDNTWVTVNVL